MQATGRVVGYMGGEEGGDIGPDYSDVCQPPPSDSVHGVAVVVAGPFDAEEIDLRLCHSLVEQEGGSADTDFNMNGAGTSENPDKINFTVQTFGL